ncbi:hypothetical protein KP509_03G094700 [Ceratopteris richardii]|nr:hypothetical protein KP509_03G094700 [Ceratopteris richardii]
MAFSGVYSNLVLYLMRDWGESSAAAANDLTNLLGTLFFTTLFGAFLGDAYWGRFWTVIIFQLMFAAGSVLVSVAATMQQHHGSTAANKAFLMAALYITALGSGSYEPAIASLGGDQFNSATEKARYFNWMFVACNVGQLPALTGITYLENRGAWALGFWISSAAVLVSVPIFLVGAPCCRQYRPGGNPLVRIMQVLVAACRKVRFPAETDPKLLYEVPGAYSIIPGCLKIQHRPKLRWLDKAATVTEDDRIMITKDTKDGEESHNNRTPNVSPWRLCTVTQVEEVKGWVGILPILIFGAIAQSIFAQFATLFVEQGALMDGSLGKTRFKIPPGSLQIITIIFSSFGAPIFDYLVVPAYRRWTKNTKGITSLQRMGIGIVSTILTMIVAAVVESRRLHLVHHGHINLSIMWLIPQYAIGGLSMALLMVGQMQFFYTEISESVRSLGICLTLVCRGLGNFISTLLVLIITSITSHRGKRLGWIPHSLDQGHLDYFYWFLASLMSIAFVLYIFYSRQYSYIDQSSLTQLTTPAGDNHELKSFDHP